MSNTGREESGVDTEIQEINWFLEGYRISKVMIRFAYLLQQDIHVRRNLIVQIKQTKDQVPPENLVDIFFSGEKFTFLGGF